MSKFASTGPFALSAVELRRQIGTKELSPVELLESCIARIETLNPALNAMTATCFGRARKEAKRAEQAVKSGDALGPLHGLPFGVKDLQSTAGVLTTYGSPLRRNNVPTEDSIMVSRVRNSGGIMVGKTNTPEFGAGANTRNPVWGATGNPFDPMRTCGGSSGGSAAALAVDMTPICTGSDTGGSLRIPAAFCGIVGFRPSPGMVPAESRSLGWTPISVLGPMARNVADARLLFEARSALTLKIHCRFRSVAIAEKVQVPSTSESSVSLGALTSAPALYRNLFATPLPKSRRNEASL